MTTLCQVYRSQAANVKVQASDGELTLLTIPSSDFDAGKLYAVVAQGMVGMFGADPVLTLEHCNLFFRNGTALINNIRCRMPLKGEGMSFAGQHAQLFYGFTTGGTPQDITLRVQVNSARSTSFAHVDEWTLTLWHLGDMAASDYKLVNTDPSASLTQTPASLVTTAALDLNEDYLVYTGIQAIHENILATDAWEAVQWWAGDGATHTLPLFPTDRSPTSIQYMAQYARTQFGKFGKSNTILPLGDMQIAEVGGTAKTPRLWANQRWNAASRVTVDRAYILAIKLSALNLSKDSVRFNPDFGLDPTGSGKVAVGAVDQRVRGLTSHQTEPMPAIILQGARFAQTESTITTPRTVFTQLEVNGAPVAPQSGYVGMGHYVANRHEVVAMTRAHQHSRDLRDCIAPIWHDEQTQVVHGPSPYPNTPRAFMPVAFSFTGDDSYQFPLLTIDSAGPDVVVIPQREALGLASLTALPIAPTDTMPIDAEAAQAHFESEGTLHAVRWPRLLNPRRGFALTWTVDDTDKATLLSFLRGLDASGAAFKWTPPDEGGEVPSLLARDWSYVNAGKGDTWRFQASVVELVYVGP